MSSIVPSTISVALCTRNGSRFIREQLDSIFLQSVAPTELVVADDASTDDTIAIVVAAVDEYRVGHPDFCFTLLRNPTALGVTANFEGALSATTGELIALADQDDIWTPNHLERLSVAFGDRPGLLLQHSDALLIDHEGASLSETLFGALEVDESTRAEIHRGGAFGVLLKRNVVTGATVMIRRRLFDLASPFPSAWVHDEWLGIVAAAYRGVDLIDESLLEYRQHGSNQIGVRTLSFCGKVKRMMEPGTTRSKRLLARAEQLDARREALDLSPVEVSAIRQKLAHERMRSSLSARRLLRVVPVLREFRTGHYTRFGRGASDAARDILQPLDAGAQRPFKKVH